MTQLRIPQRCDQFLASSNSSLWLYTKSYMIMVFNRLGVAVSFKIALLALPTAADSHVETQVLRPNMLIE